MALIRCGECGKDVSDKAASCPACGAPVSAEGAIAAPERVSYEDGVFVATSAQMAELASKAVRKVDYRVDHSSAEDRSCGFTTGVTMGSWSGVSGTISWREVAPYRFEVEGSGKQNVQGGQMVAANLFDEANAKARKVISAMIELAGGPKMHEQASTGCALFFLMAGGAGLAIVGAATAAIAGG